MAKMQEEGKKKGDAVKKQADEEAAK